MSRNINNVKIIDKKNEVELSQSEYYKLYSFFVTYSLCKSLSRKRRTLIDYGHNANKIKIIDKELEKYIKMDSISFEQVESNSLVLENLVNNDLMDDTFLDVERERGMFINHKESNKYYNLFHHIRNSLAHAEFVILLNSNNEKVLVMQSSKDGSIKSRLVIKVDTLLSIINIIDKNCIIK